MSSNVKGKHTYLDDARYQLLQVSVFASHAVFFVSPKLSRASELRVSAQKTVRFQAIICQQDMQRQAAPVERGVQVLELRD